MVVIGRLQSLVPATAGNVGASFLRHLYLVLHAEDGCGMLPSCAAYYHQDVSMMKRAWEELDWWRHFLEDGKGACIHAADPAVLV